MEIRKSDLPRRATSPHSGKINFELRISLIFILLIAGCASPSEPFERKPPVARAITDLAAAQSADDVVLTFTLPTETVDRLPLKQPLAIEIYRGIGTPGSESRAHMSLVATLPAASVDQYSAQGHVRYADSLKAEDFASRDVVGATYAVRARASAKRDSEPSNAVYLLLRAAPDPITDLKAEVTRPAIALNWSAPGKTLSGSAPAITGYRVYRAETEAAPSNAAETPNLKTPLAKIGESESPSFRDTQFEFGKTYEYSVRSVIGSGAESLESADSNLAIVAALDTFPPAAPLGLVVTFVPQQGDTPGHLELSWSISPETDIAGYNVYRSEQAGASETRLNTELLLTPAFRDMNVEPGRVYFYNVTAVDRSGNESSRSEAASGNVPAESQRMP